jgi:hypothetical protein
VLSRSRKRNPSFQNRIGYLRFIKFQEGWHIHLLKKLLSFFTGSSKGAQSTPPIKAKPKPERTIEAARIGELGEYKINIQLDQLPAGCKYISDIMVSKKGSRSGYSQIDHVIVSPQAIFVIETKNYNGKIKGSREDLNWTVNGRFKMYNPIKQNNGHIKALQPILSSYSSLSYVSIVSFTMRCRFSIDPILRKIESDELVVYDVELSEYILRKINRIQATATSPMLTGEEVDDIIHRLQQANITDPLLRMEHVEKLNNTKVLRSE